MIDWLFDSFDFFDIVYFSLFILFVLFVLFTSSLTPFNCHGFFFLLVPFFVRSCCEVFFFLGTVLRSVFGIVTGFPSCLIPFVLFLLFILFVLFVLFT